MGAHQEYLTLLEGLCGTLDRLTEIARKKIDATRQSDLMALNECMKQEQVVTLSLKTIEKKRQGLLSAMQLENVPLNRLWEHYPEELRPRCREVTESLRSRYQLYESAANAARTLMERALRDIEKMMPPDESTPPGETPPQVRTDFRA